MRKTDEYANGIENLAKQMIRFCQKEIDKTKHRTPKNSIRQITNGGKIAAYNKVIQKLLVKKRIVEIKRRD